MGIIKAHNLPEPKPEQSLEDYINSRITNASEQGYGSTNVWLRKDSLEEGLTLLKEAGYKTTIYKKEDNGNTQVRVSW